MCKPYTLEESEALTRLALLVAIRKDTRDISLSYLRYEALRKLNPRQFSELHARNLQGENFDRMVDELIVKNAT